MTWTQPLCRPCWALTFPGRFPARLLEPVAEICCKCATTTTAGIYARVDPATVPYPRSELS